ncbi:hypothetical protein THII_1373 [Thioploca ingrica]|uniref:Uncharacterized protein n=1 Tax=Thioploca ingrica TaxID=40754 RepID=A0A090AKT2_9GAMM|nr:hypothetical protein THII_1373 [Thioploca ingrica]
MDRALLRYLFRLTHDNLPALEETRIEVARGVLKYLHTRLHVTLPAAEK